MVFASGFTLVKSITFPFSIHSEPIANLWPLAVTPRNGMIFERRRCFHMIASLQSF